MAQEKQKPLTRDDVLKLMKEHGGTAKGLDLSGKVFEAGIDLSNLNLEGIILRKARFAVSFIRGTAIIPADIGVQLQNANLMYANLQEASLRFANLQKANLSRADLRGANLSNANLEGASLYGFQISPDTQLENTGWGNYIIGEENNNLFAQAEAPYRQLKMWYTNAGYHHIAAKFYYREKEANRKSLKLCSRHRLAAEFMRVLFGYGEEWKRILIWIAVVIFGLAGAYHLLGSFSSSSCLDTLYYSAVSFTALGYGKWAPQPTGWAKAVGVAEAIIGVFMMALLLVTFVRKWTR